MQTGFKSVHPLSAFVFFGFAFVLSMVASHPLLLAVGFLTGLMYDVKLCGKKAASYFGKLILPMTVLIALFNALFSHYGVTVLYKLPNGNSITLEALVYGFVFALRIASALLWLDCFNEVVTSDKFLFLFGRVSPRTALVLSMVLRFIPLVRAQSEEIARAEKGVGNAPTGGHFFAKLRQGARRLSVLISWTLEKGIDTADSMRARGYALAGRTSYNRYAFTARDGAFLGGSLAATGMLFAVEAKCKAYYNPMIDIPTPDVLSGLWFLLITAALCAPILYDIGEERKWSISR